MFGILHTDGSGDNNPPLESLSDLYDELKFTDPEHGDVAVMNDDLGWYMSAHRDGRVIFAQYDHGVHRHMMSVPKERVLKLWKRLIAGDIDGLLLEPWKEGFSDS